MILATAERTLHPGIDEVEHQRRVHGQGRMQAARRLPGAIADCADELADGARRPQRQRMAVAGDAVALGRQAGGVHLQALDRGIDVATRAAGTAVTAGLFARSALALDWRRAPRIEPEREVDSPPVALSAPPLRDPPFPSPGAGRLAGARPGPGAATEERAGEKLAEVHRTRRKDFAREAEAWLSLWSDGQEDDGVALKLVDARKRAGDMAGAAGGLRFRAEGATEGERHPRRCGDAGRIEDVGAPEHSGPNASPLGGEVRELATRSDAPDQADRR